MNTNRAKLGSLLLPLLPLSCPALTFVDEDHDNASGGPNLTGAHDIVVSPDNKHVYVAAALDDALTAFTRNSTTGELTFLATYPNGTGGVNSLDSCRGVAISPDGKHVYTAALLSSAVTAFSRNASTGALTFLAATFDDVNPGPTSPGLTGAQDLALSPDGKHLYVTARSEDAITTYSRNATTGLLTFVQTLFDNSGGVNGLDAAEGVFVSPDGKHVYVAAEEDNAVSVFSRNASTGALTFVEAKVDGLGGADGLNNANDLVVSPDGKHLYVTCSIDGFTGTEDWIGAFSRNQVTGALTYVERHPNVALGSSIDCYGITNDCGIAAHPTDPIIFVTNNWTSAVAEFSRNPVTGSLTLTDHLCRLGDFNLRILNALAVSPDGHHFYATNLSASVVSYSVLDPIQVWARRQGLALETLEGNEDGDSLINFAELAFGGHGATASLQIAPGIPLLPRPLRQSAEGVDSFAIRYLRRDDIFSQRVRYTVQFSRNPGTGPFTDANSPGAPWTNTEPPVLGPSHPTPEGGSVQEVTVRLSAPLSAEAKIFGRVVVDPQ